MKNDVMISVRNASKAFSSSGKLKKVLANISLDVYTNEFICIIGPSGCGKSTFLRVISGMEVLDEGEVYINGVQHNSPNEDVIMLFQDYNQLFPWKTVIGNIIHPLLAIGKATNRSSARAKGMELLKAVELEGFADYYPHQMSGGMKQRAAIARALAMEPKVLLMDEPLAALDDITRKTLRVLIRDVCATHNVTTLCVTHSVEDATILGNRIVKMSKSSHDIEQVYENTAYGHQIPCPEYYEMREKLIKSLAIQ